MLWLPRPLPSICPVIMRRQRDAFLGLIGFARHGCSTSYALVHCQILPKRFTPVKCNNIYLSQIVERLERCRVAK
jgi:hypothetical protein